MLRPQRAKHRHSPSFGLFLEESKITMPAVDDIPKWLLVLIALICLAIGFVMWRLGKIVEAPRRKQPGGEQKKEQAPAAVAAVQPGEEFVEEVSSMPPPRCPQCRHPMVLRRAKTGPGAGKQFWGCSKYPDCRATLEVVVPRQFGRQS